MTTTNPKREFDLNFPLIKIKEIINSTFRLAGNRLLDKNDLIHTYRFCIVSFLNTAIVTIQLSEIDANKTHCIFEAFNTAGSRLATAVISGMQDKYIKTFTDLLEGKIKITEPVKIDPVETKAHNRKMTTYLVVGLFVVALFFFLFQFYPAIISLTNKK